MQRQPQTLEREIIVADAIGDVANELRLVELADYVALIRLESLASLADIVDTAAEPYFMPGTLTLGHGCEADVSWTEAPRVALDLELRPIGATVHFTLSLTASQAGVDIGYVSFDRPSDDPVANTRFLAAALERSRIRKTVPTAAEAR